MKFELFGKLRDDGDKNSGTGNNTPSNSNSEIGGLGGSSSNPQIGGGLEQNVQQMFSQGYSEEEIRQELQGQYSENEIEQAVNRTIKSSATGNSKKGGGPEPMTPYEGGDDTVSPMDEGYNQDEQEQMNQNNPPPPNPGMNNQPTSSAPDPLPQQGENNQNNANVNVDESVEEMVETIVAENLERVEKEFENAYSEIDEIKEKLEDFEERVHDLEVRDDEDQTQFIQKMDELEEDIDSYQARMGGLEKAFQQILPSLVDNVRDLTSLVQEIKQERGIETEANMSKEDIQDIDMEDW
jgi:archaellum component FlaC